VVQATAQLHHAAHSETPTKADAQAALKLIDGLLDEFPLVDDVARSVALAALMTPVLRGAYTVALQNRAQY
jgi:putative DNA primase/helicase